ncbi:MAG: hypothetical protein O2954_14525 [bacterium]|nr:hypothetical protein [bacterium]
MAKVLIIDGNPDHCKALRGLFDSRTAHVAVFASTCVEGARACMAESPDIIMVNALLYMGHNFAFSRVLKRYGKTRVIPVLVHSTGELEALTRRRIEFHGAIGFVELPVSAGEVIQEIQEALGRTPSRSASKVAKPVSWPTVPKAEGKNESSEARPVDWAAVGRKHTERKLNPGRPKARPAADQPDPKANTARGLRRNGGAGPASFRTASYDSVDPSEVKGGSEKPEDTAFRRTKWPRIDPDEVKNSGQNDSE